MASARQTLETPVFSVETSRAGSIHDVHTLDQPPVDPGAYVRVDDNTLDQNWLEAQPNNGNGRRGITI